MLSRKREIANALYFPMYLPKYHIAIYPNTTAVTENSIIFNIISFSYSRFHISATLSAKLDRITCFYLKKNEKGF